MPALLFFTDPERTPEPEAIAHTLPAGAAMVFRAFGAPGAAAQGARLMAIVRQRKLTLLVGADAGLAARLAPTASIFPNAWRIGRADLKPPIRAGSSRPQLIPRAAARRGLKFGADAVVVSAAFPSRSASAGPPLGAIRLAILVRRVKGPVYALGGIDNKKARLLKDTGLVGLAAVDAFRT